MEERLIRHNFYTVNLSELALELNASESKIFLIEAFPDDNSILEDFIQKLGTPIQEHRNEHNDFIFDVKVNKSNRLFKSFANSNYYFPLHTDCADFENIPNGVAMLCSIPAIEGGESSFVKIDELISKLTVKEIAYLIKKEWYFRNVKRSILSENDTEYSICYNRIILESFSNLAETELEFLDKLDHKIRNISFEYKLKANELLLFRNDKILHGRNDFSEQSNRLIKRIRFLVN